MAARRFFRPTASACPGASRRAAQFTMRKTMARSKTTSVIAPAADLDFRSTSSAQPTAVTSKEVSVMPRTRKEIAFIDQGVTDLQTLLAGLRPEVEPIVLPTQGRPVAHMAELL